MLCVPEKTTYSIRGWLLHPEKLDLFFLMCVLGAAASEFHSNNLERAPLVRHRFHYGNIDSDVRT